MGGFRIIQMYFLLVSQCMSDGSELDNTLDYQSGGSKDRFPASPVFRVRLNRGPVSVVGGTSNKSSLTISQ